MILAPWRWAGLIACAGLWVQAQTPLTDARSTLEKWIEARQLISKTRADWQSDKEMLGQTIDLLERESRSLGERMAALGTNSVQAEQERGQAEASLRTSNESLDRTRRFVAEFEPRLKAQVPRLPAPLQEILQPLMNRLPADPASTTMSATERLQVVVGILNELDKFNNAVSLFTEKRKNAKGEEVAVETLYLGLGAAWFVNEANDFAGSGAPGARGWEWAIQSGIAPSVRAAIQMYRNEKPARFVALPAAVR